MERDPKRIAALLIKPRLRGRVEQNGDVVVRSSAWVPSVTVFATKERREAIPPRFMNSRRVAAECSSIVKMTFYGYMRAVKLLPNDLPDLRFGGWHGTSSPELRIFRPFFGHRLLNIGGVKIRT